VRAPQRSPLRPAAPSGTGAPERPGGPPLNRNQPSRDALLAAWQALRARSVHTIDFPAAGAARRAPAAASRRRPWEASTPFSTPPSVRSCRPHCCKGGPPCGKGGPPRHRPKGGRPPRRRLPLPGPPGCRSTGPLNPHRKVKPVRHRPQCRAPPLAQGTCSGAGWTGAADGMQRGGRRAPAPPPPRRSGRESSSASSACATAIQRTHPQTTLAPVVTRDLIPRGPPPAARQRPAWAGDSAMGGAE
jgi:hypothetical protein